MTRHVAFNVLSTLILESKLEGLPTGISQRFLDVFSTASIPELVNRAMELIPESTVVILGRDFTIEDLLALPRCSNDEAMWHGCYLMLVFEQLWKLYGGSGRSDSGIFARLKNYNAYARGTRTVVENTLAVEKALATEGSKGYARRLWTSAPGAVTANEVLILETAMMTKRRVYSCGDQELVTSNRKGKARADTDTDVDDESPDFLIDERTRSDHDPAEQSLLNTHAENDDVQDSDIEELPTRNRGRPALQLLSQ
ncbi:hypothetical protein HDK77DRAFT_484895 [Phyllosticta capitalensis]